MQTYTVVPITKRGNNLLKQSSYTYGHWCW